MSFVGLKKPLSYPRTPTILGIPVAPVILGLGLLLLARSQPESAAAMPAPATPYMLTVVNGFGSGIYPAGSTIHIWANSYEQGWSFDAWKGETQALPDIRSMHITTIMPSHNIRVEATYKEILVWKPSYARMSGREALYYLPPSDTKGMIILFHGSGGSAREWPDLGAEGRTFFDDAIAAGYAVLAVDSGNRVEKQWDLAMPPASNSDLEAVAAILTTFQASGQIPVDTPIYAVGMSRGGRFATLVSSVLSMEATAIWVGAGHADVMETTTVPTIWCLADHDPIIDREEAFAQYEQLTSRGVDAGFYIHPKTPLYPQYFSSIEGMDAMASEEFFSALKSQGYLDEKNFLTSNPRLSRWEKHVGIEYSEAVRLDIQDRLFVAYAEHAFYSDCDHHVLDFFDSHP